ncbi:MAG: polysaccharide deacetylase family protein [Bacilli bacterium]|nr:polysaccharide deacetylase family protein [Bacilli bacterium]
MKKFFECIGMISLVCVSFFFTEKTARVVKETDNIMVEIKKAAESHVNHSIDAMIKEDTIIPGIYGGIVDEEKSYEKMKRVGSYQENLLVYKKIAPMVSIEKNFDKYIISGNPKKNMVTLLFLVQDNDDTTKIEKILQQKEVKASFFVDGNWFENHNDKIYEWINEEHTVGNLSYGMDYKNSSFIWMDTIIKRVGNQKISFCYNEKPNKDALKLCAANKNYTIRPNIIIAKSPLSEIKLNLVAGSIIALPINQTVEKELPVIIEYIRGKGYKLENLYHHLEEDK